ncbi:MAG TPA: hypothetical protein VMU87_05920 [Stellaceae bacterium]|nr:hypothetical protein [Stellaceae bacterium]
MQMRDAVPAIDGEVMQAAHRAAQREGARFVIGWWNDGVERALMLLPEGHRVTEERPFQPLVRVTPTGQAECLDSTAVIS